MHIQLYKTFLLFIVILFSGLLYMGPLKNYVTLILGLLDTHSPLLHFVTNSKLPSHLPLMCDVTLLNFNRIFFCFCNNVFIVFLIEIGVIEKVKMTKMASN